MVDAPPTYLSTESGKVRLHGLWVQDADPDPRKPVVCRVSAERKGHFHKKLQKMEQATEDILDEMLKPEINGLLVVDATLSSVLENVFKFLQNMP